MSRCRVDSIVRVRPLVPIDKHHTHVIRTSPDNCVRVDKDNQTIQLVRDEYESKQFRFRSVLNADSLQVDVYRSTKDIINGFLQGYNGCILAYGASGTGKSYTIFGNDCERNPPFPATSGLMQMAACDILSSMSPQETLYISFYEIYCDEITDLLVEDVPMDTSPLHIRETKDGVCIEGLSQIPVTLETLFPLIHRGIRSRRTSRTAANARSSRSHAIVEMTLERRRSNGKLLRNVLTFGDLAGSERIKRATLVHQQLREAKAINTSIVALGHCIQLLSQSKAHIPYRDSKLTRLLATSLGGNSHTCIVSTIGPCGYHYEESYSTLTFATKVGTVERMVQPAMSEASAALLSERMKEWKWPAKLFEDVPSPNTHYVDNDCISTSTDADHLLHTMSELLETTALRENTVIQNDTSCRSDIVIHQNNATQTDIELPVPSTPEGPPPECSAMHDYCYVVSDADIEIGDRLKSPSEEHTRTNDVSFIARYESIGSSGSEGSSVGGGLELMSEDEWADNVEENYINDNNSDHEIAMSQVFDDQDDKSSESDESDDAFGNVFICDASSPTAIPAVLHNLDDLRAATEFESLHEEQFDDQRPHALQLHNLTDDPEVEIEGSSDPIVGYSSVRLSKIPSPPSHPSPVLEVTVSKVALSMDLSPPPPSIAASETKTCVECQYAQEEISYLRDKITLQEEEINRLTLLVEQLQN